MDTPLPLSFTARHVTGAGRGKLLGTPTVNLALPDVPPALTDGVYACRAVLDAETQSREAVMHLGPRPVFKDTRSCEVHLLETPAQKEVVSVRVEVVAKLRGPETFAFPSVEALMTQIKEDIAQARRALAVDSGQ